MKTIALPPPLGDSLASLLKAVDGAIEERELRLGGGTALAVLWKHRFSTDIDLACDPQVFERAFSPEGRAALRERLRQRREKRARLRFGHPAFIRHCRLELAARRRPGAAPPIGIGLACGGSGI